MGILIRLEHDRSHLDPIVNKAFKRLLDYDRKRYDRQVAKLRQIREYGTVKRELDKKRKVP